MVKVGIGSEAGTAVSGSKRPASAPPSPDAIARHFPQLEIIELLGSGGMGAVYKARQREIDRLVALKILPSEAAGDPGFAERFAREARALARLNHPNIVGLYHFGQVDGLHYFIMEYVDGLNLRQLEQAGRLSPREALQIIPQICEALQFAHDEGIVHRDIKPENVLLDKKGRVKIADFGLARILGHEPEDFRLTRDREVMGTPHYMAPEQVEKPQSVDHRADIYSLGVVFYEMLTGELPLGRFAPPSQKVQIDVRLDDVVLRALEKEPGRRYQQANEVKTAMDTILTQPPASTVGAAPTLPRSGSHQAQYRWQTVVVAAVAVLLLMAVVSVLVWRRSSAARAEAQAAALAAMIHQSNATVSQEPKLGANSGWWYVSGEVKTPSRRPYDSRMTVLQAITSAGDFTAFADKEHVRLTGQDGRSQVVDCLKALDDPSLDPEVRPGDTIHVGRRLGPVAPPTAPMPAANAQPAEAPSEAFARRYGIRPPSLPNAGASPKPAIPGRYGPPSSTPPPAPNGPSPISPAPTPPTPLNYQWRTGTNNTSGVMTPESPGNVTGIIAPPASPTELPILPVPPVSPTAVIPALAPPDSSPSVSFTVAANGTSPIAYQWYKTLNGSTNLSAPPTSDSGLVKRCFTVLGQVQRPGTYDMPTDESVSLLQAIALAGDYTRLGNPHGITVERMVDKANTRMKLDAAAMAAGKNQRPFVIQPGDVIVVGEKAF